MPVANYGHMKLNNDGDEKYGNRMLKKTDRSIQTLK
jgi:hypothetical protein